MRAVAVRLSGGGGGAFVRPLANDKDNTCRGCFASPGLIIFVPDDNFSVVIRLYVVWVRCGGAYLRLVRWICAVRR